MTRNNTWLQKNVWLSQTESASWKSLESFRKLSLSCNSGIWAVRWVTASWLSRILLEKVLSFPSSVFASILPSLVTHVGELLDLLFLYIVILHEVALVHVAQAQIFAFFWKSLSIESEADHSPLLQKQHELRLWEYFSTWFLCFSRKFFEWNSVSESIDQASCSPWIDVLDLLQFSRIFALLNVLQNFFFRYFELHCLDFLYCENNATSLTMLLCENHAIGFPLLDRTDDELCPEFSFLEP